MICIWTHSRSERIEQRDGKERKSGNRKSGTKIGRFEMKRTKKEVRSKALLFQTCKKTTNHTLDDEENAEKSHEWQMKWSDELIEIKKCRDQLVKAKLSYSSVS